MAFFALTLLFWTCAAVLCRIPCYPFNDDWTYVLSVQQSLRSGALQLSQGVAATGVFHVSWGCLFSLPAGFSFDALRFANLFLAWLGILALYQTARTLGATKGASLAGACALLFNPLYFHLSFSFMTDAPTLALVLLSGYAYVSGIKKNDDRRLFAGSALSTMAFLVRQTGAGMALGTGLWLVLHGERRGRRLALVLGLPLLAASMYALRLWSGEATFGLQRYALSSLLNSPHFFTHFSGTVVERLAGASLYLGFALTPWILEDWPRRRGSALCLAGFAALWACVLLFRLNPVPGAGNIIGRYGLGGCPFISSCDYKPAGIFGWPGFWRLATTAFLVSAALFAWKLGGLKGRAGPEGAYYAGFGLAFLPSLLSGNYYDRYYLVLIPPALLFAALRFKTRLPGALLALGILAAWSILGTWDTLASNEARWRAGEALRSMGLSASEISNGTDWESYYNFDARLAELEKTRPAKDITWDDLWRSPGFRGFSSFAPASLSPEMRRVGDIPYWTPLTMKTERIYLWINPGKPARI